MQHSASFKDLAPTETEAADIVGGAFLDIGPAVIALLGAVVSIFGHID